MKTENSGRVSRSEYSDRVSRSESIPPSLRNLLTKLEYISMIERGQKPCFSDMTFVNSNSWVGAWKRLFSGENRKNLLFEIEQIIDRTILAIEEYTNKDYVKLLLENLNKAKVGIENLILTYTEHPDTVSNLRVHIINIDLTLKKHGLVTNMNSSIETLERSEYQKIIENLNDEGFGGRKRTTPLPIVQQTLDTNFKRFTPKDYIEKHILSSSTSSPDHPIDKSVTHQNSIE
jgi:hypothetical protein